MSSFSCPHHDSNRDACARIGDVCVPGRPGCVLHRNSVFAVPWEKRLEAKRQACRPNAADTASGRR
jgi:hypothetical protein